MLKFTSLVAPESLLKCSGSYIFLAEIEENFGFSRVKLGSTFDGGRLEEGLFFSLVLGLLLI